MPTEAVNTNKMISSILFVYNFDAGNRKEDYLSSSSKPTSKNGDVEGKVNFVQVN